MKRMLIGPSVIAGLLVAVSASACGSSSPANTEPTPTPVVPASSGASPPVSTSPTGTPSATGSASAGPSAAPTGAKSATCVNGWTQAAPGSDFFRQAQQAVTDTLGLSETPSAVRYFAGPLVAGGVGAVYYVELPGPRLAVRAVVVSAGGPSTYAVAPLGTHGWRSGDWSAFGGSDTPKAYPPLPGTWAGPPRNPVSGPSALLSPQLAGCLDGT